MIEFHINKPDHSIKSLLEAKIDNLTKPKGSLGILEELAIRVGIIQQSLEPYLSTP